ncbi:hypothetical protein PL10110_230115 [Planktothrix agardhii]|nr:hypothetical protein PL10110_230115 [Planktothrix agardhii]
MAKAGVAENPRITVNRREIMNPVNKFPRFNIVLSCCIIVRIDLMSAGFPYTNYTRQWFSFVC